MGRFSIFIQFLFSILFLLLSLVSEGSALWHSLAVRLSGRDRLQGPGAPWALTSACALSRPFVARVCSLSSSDFWLVDGRSKQDGGRRPAGLWALRSPFPPLRRPPLPTASPGSGVPSPPHALRNRCGPVFSSASSVSRVPECSFWALWSSYVLMLRGEDLTVSPRFHSQESHPT